MDGCGGAWFEDAVAIEGQEERFTGKEERMEERQVQSCMLGRKENDRDQEPAML
jgi:hypothetical protein